MSLTIMTVQSDSKAPAIVLITLSYTDLTEETHGTDGTDGADGDDICLKVSPRLQLRQLEASLEFVSVCIDVVQVNCRFISH